MTPLRPDDPNTALARWILDVESEGTGAVERLRALERAVARLESQMVLLVGQLGFESVLGRAMHLSKEHAPWLAQSRLRTTATVVIREASDTTDEEDEARGRVRAHAALEGLAEAARDVDPAELDAGATLVLTNLIGLFRKFIGEGLTRRVLRKVWPQLPQRRESAGPEEA